MNRRGVVLAAAALALLCWGTWVSLRGGASAGRYFIAASANPGTAWRVNSATGEVSVCRAAAPDSLRGSPLCSPWGPNPVP
jgi:hypothetical protein